MKLHEIFDPSTKLIDIRSKEKDGNLKYPKNFLARGTFSNVTSTKDEHLIQKTSIKNPTEDRYTDAFWDYANEIIKSEIWKSNPYFPRFYSIKEYKTNNVPLYKGIIEKLESFNKISPDILVGWMNKVFDMDKIQTSEFGKTVIYYINNNKDNSNDDNLKYYISALLIKVLRDYNLYLEYIKDKKFIEALGWIKQLSDKLKASHDLHEGNVMFRRGSTGIQLVITDPLVYPK